MAIEISIKDEMSVEEKEALFAGLHSHNKKSAYGDPTTFKGKFVISLKDNESFFACAQCVQKDNWIFLEYLWVDETYQGKGFGKKLIDAVKSEAIARNCNGIHLETYDFQGAESFYKKSGFQEFARIENYPTGFARIYFLMRF